MVSYIIGGKKGGIAIKFLQDDNCENILNMRYYSSVYPYKLKFVRDFELTMLQ